MYTHKHTDSTLYIELNIHLRPETKPPLVHCSYSTTVQKLEFGSFVLSLRPCNTRGYKYRVIHGFTCSTANIGSRPADGETKSHSVAERKLRYPRCECTPEVSLNVLTHWMKTGGVRVCFHR